MIALKSITVEEAFANLHGRVLLVVVGSLSIGLAMEKTGVAQWVGRGIVDITLSGGDYWVCGSWLFASLKHLS
jgi:di/tricarboxylate transporter